ncbi:hypothetical protein B5M09_008044 [Aphanomyces astaci]|uniref:Ubiquitin-like domain-containing protein n=1 Tax=Aphanomyces astaci TaxID=112090 RepID=A0A425D1C8_APHAT|nr:hypothetical protein B5M09_008044 [Aphanomyces astaci]
MVRLVYPSNKLHEASSFLGSLVRLRELSLSANVLTSLPDTLGLLLRSVSVQQNLLETLPPLSSLVLLETLDVSKNKLAAMPALDALRRLKSVDLRHNRLDDLPTLPSTLTMLFAGHNRLRDLPQLERLAPALTVLDVRCNQLDALPPSIASLDFLTSLDVSNNNLSDLPPGRSTIDPLLSSSLAAENNYLTSLPVDIAELPRLQALRVQKNRLTDAALAAVVHITAPIRYTLVVRFPKRELDVRNNNLTKVPPGLSAFQLLDTLLVSFNQITALDGVHWANMTKLTSCLASNNRIPIELGQTVHLRLVNIQGNPQRHIRSSVVQRGPHAVLQHLQQLAEKPVDLTRAPAKRPLDQSPSATWQNDDESPPSTKRRATEDSNVLIPVETKSLAQQIQAAEAEMDGFGVSSARLAALKKELANLRKQQAQHE